MNTKNLIILCIWTGLTALSMAAQWLGEGTYSMILIFGAVLITLAVGFGMGSDVSPKELDEIRNEISKLREQVEALKAEMDKIRKPT